MQMTARSLLLASGFVVLLLVVLAASVLPGSAADTGQKALACVFGVGLLGPLIAAAVGCVRRRT